MLIIIVKSITPKCWTPFKFTACYRNLLQTQAFSVFQSTVAAQTPPLSAVRRREGPQRLGGTPGEARDPQVTHR